MSRKASAWVLLGLIVAVGLLFFQVIRPFVIAIFVSIVLAVLFAPVHAGLTTRLGGRQRVAAALTTTFVLVLVLMPIGVTLVLAGTQAMEVGKEVIDWFDQRQSNDFEETLGEIEQTHFGRNVQEVYLKLSPVRRDQIQVSVSRLSEGATTAFYKQTRSLLSNAFAFLVNSMIVTLATYYFLADRQVFVGELHRLIPLDDGEEEAMTDQFQNVCRSVVLGTLVAGLVQAVLAGLAFAVLGIPQVWMLMVLALFCSFVPFLGSAIVWGLVAVWLMFEGRYGAGIGLALYGGAIISTSDNLVRSQVIGNQTHLHPLIALVTALGALQFIGLWGIFVGPMVAALLYPLIYIVRDRFAERPGDRHIKTTRDALTGYDS